MHSSAIEFKPSATPHRESASWAVAEIEALLALPFMELVFRAAEIHRQFFDPTKVQLSTLISIKTGGCPRTAVIVRSRRITTPRYPISRC